MSSEIGILGVRNNARGRQIGCRIVGVWHKNLAGGLARETVPPEQLKYQGSTRSKAQALPVPTVGADGSSGAAPGSLWTVA